MPYPQPNCHSCAAKGTNELISWDGNIIAISVTQEDGGGGGVSVGGTNQVDNNRQYAGTVYLY